MIDELDCTHGHEHLKAEAFRRGFEAGELNAYLRLAEPRTVHESAAPGATTWYCATCDAPNASRICPAEPCPACGATTVRSGSISGRAADKSPQSPVETLGVRRAAGVQRSRT